MEVGVIGLSHRLARLQVREIFAKICSRRFDPTRSTHGDSHAFVLLSTCNRTEIYFHSADLAYTHSYLLNIFRQDGGKELSHLFYSFFRRDCLLHLALVTSGLDSAIIGETEIQGQVARAYEASRRLSKLPSDVHILFQKCLHIGKRIRSTHTWLRARLDLGTVIFHQAAQLFPNVQSRRVLFIGASEINDQVLQKFKAKGLTHLTLCSRSFERARLLAQQVGVTAVAWQQPEQWLSYDIVVCGTRSPHYLLTQSVLAPLKEPRLIIDLSVPRNVDPLIAKEPKLTLLNIEAIHDTVNSVRRTQGLLVVSEDVKEMVDRTWELWNERRCGLALGA